MPIENATSFSARFAAVMKKRPPLVVMFNWLVSMLTVIPSSSVAVPFLYCPDMCSVTFFPETSVISIFIQSVSLKYEGTSAPLAVKLPYFIHCPAETPGLYSVANEDVRRAIESTQANTIAVFDLDIDMTLSSWFSLLRCFFGCLDIKDFRQTRWIVNILNFASMYP